MKTMAKEKLIELYTVMLRIRLVELKIEELYPQDEMKTPIHLCIGQEAASAGVCANLKKEDYVFSNHRSHGHYLAKGGDMKTMIAELLGRETGCSRGRGGSMHLIDTRAGLYGSSSIIAGAIPIATGAALSSALQKNGKVSVVFFGDAGAEQGVFYESANFAALKKLPIVFVCENNLYSVCTPLAKRQPNKDLYRRLAGFAIPGYKVDGNDVLEVYDIAGKTIGDARAGKGPSLIECKTYRWRDHAGSGADIKMGYRTQKEVERWMARCPIKRLEALLKKRNILSDKEKTSIVNTIGKEIAEAFDFAKKSPLPGEDGLSAHLYK